MRTHVLAAGERAAVEDHWTALQRSIGEVGLMCSWEWTGTWLDHYGEIVPHRFVVAEDERGVRGVALVAEQSASGRLRPPTAVLGTAGEPPGSSVFVERNKLLVHPGDRAAFAAALLAELGRDRRWQRLRLDGMVVEDAVALLDGRTGVRRRSEECPLARLDDANVEDVMASLPAGTRRRIRQSLQRLGPLESEWARTVPAASTMLDELADLHQAHWHAKGRSGAFSSSRFRGFHRDLIARLIPARRAALYRVRHNGTTVACLYGLIEGDRLLFYQSGLARHEDNRVRVGLVAHALFMQACRDEGLAAYDFLAPAVRYKSELSNDSEQLIWAELERPGLRMHLERIARAAKRRVNASGRRR
ncbi:MAG TPA: GNAT family N-acetyltransferase [Solirubrobacteraceae bacterium]|jgi:CelD/BcsL family acetyltransferase involved in cellulose biosynthesis|nr:GNAT family N-acetyltransferase [Solirubrobacteraceae bacterium]